MLEADIGRCFFWSENILWKDDLQGRRVTVSLGGEDLIVNTNAVGHYLAQEDREEQASEEWKVRPWKGNGLDILWFEKLDHAQVFDSKQSYDMLVDVIIEYSLANE